MASSSQPPKKKGKNSTLFSYFSKGRECTNVQEESNIQSQNQPSSSPIQNQASTPILIQNQEPLCDVEVERDPGKRKKVNDWPLELRDEVRRKYLSLGAYQPKQVYFRPRQYHDNSRKFQVHWYKEFNWLEYSPTTHKAYCFPCFLFGENEKSSSALLHDGFDSWKRVHQGKECVFRIHIGTSSSSVHNRCVAYGIALMKPSTHIDQVIQRISSVEISKHRLRLKATITVILRLALQGCAFRGHDESQSSLNRGNVIEWIYFLTQWRADVNDVALYNAPKNAKYISSDIQKEILAIIANRVRWQIREEVGDACFSILVDEAQVLRFVNSAGILTERFFAIKGVSETSSETLKQVICDVLSQYNLQVDKLRGQGYDGASNMSGQFNGLKALFLKDCPYAYFVHCDFYSILDKVINIVKSSPKRNTELQDHHRRHIDAMLESGDIQSGQGANQMTSLKRAGATRWSSHYSSVKSIISMFSATVEVIRTVKDHNTNRTARAEARGAWINMQTFEFAFNLHLMKEIMGITDYLCQAFQQESIDILAALVFVSKAKRLLQELRDGGWEKLIEEVMSFCSKYEVEIPDFNTITGRGDKQMTLEHMYHVDYFNQSIDFQLGALNSRFNESSVRLLQLSVALDPSNSFRSFNSDHIYKLAEEFYPQDFQYNELIALEGELKYYDTHVVGSDEFQVSSLAKLLEKLVESGMERHYIMICRLIRLVLTLPVSTATTERAFSAMKYVKNDLRNKMADEFLANSLTIFIEREFAINIDPDSIIEEFARLKDRRVQLTF
ncbi:Zinc finger MYM-type protein 1 [Linum perenne]